MANEEVRRLFEADQSVRRHGLPPLSAVPRMLWGDWHRRRRIRQLIATNALAAPDDEYRAGFILQHSLRLEDYWLAHELAMNAANSGYGPARWLAAATLDRWQMRQGRPQKFGTQYVRVGVPRWAWWVWWGTHFRLWDVDPTTTDAERADWGLPPLEFALEQASTIAKSGEPKRVGPTIATLDIGELCVEIQDIQALWATAPPETGYAPRFEPLRQSDQPCRIAVPEGCSLCRVGDGFGIIDVSGTVVALWRHRTVRENEPYCYYWRWPTAPRVSAAPIGHRTAVRIDGEPDGSTALVVRAEPGACWYVWGTLPWLDLAQLAETLGDSPR